MNEKYIYIYNNSFLSLLNLIKTLFKNKIVPQDIKPQDYSPSLFDKIVNLDIKEDEQVIEDIINYLSSNILNTLYYVYLSSNEHKELIIYYFWGHSLKYKNKIFYMRNLKSVNAALKISKYVSRENHRLKGFLRFKELSNRILYAEIAPENNIIFLLSKHFRKRLNNEYWMIKDVKRNIYCLYDKKDCFFVDGQNFEIGPKQWSMDENNIQSLWKTFYKTIGISQRKNKRCQMNFMPKKYWKYIIEMSEDDEESYN